MSLAKSWVLIKKKKVSAIKVLITLETEKKKIAIE